MLKESHTSSSADAKPPHQQQKQLSDSNNQIDLIRRTCSQFEKLLQQELTNRAKLEAENDALKLTVNKLRNQISAHEKERSANNELIRVLNATLMERETEVSILKLKMTRLQTNSSASISQHFNPPSNPSLVRQDPCKAYTMAGRSNSEFTRNSTARSTMMAEAISTRSSTSQLQRHSDDRDASVWATVPEELTPSKRPVLLERNLPQLYEHCHNISSTIRNQSSTPILRDRRYRILPLIPTTLIFEPKLHLQLLQSQFGCDHSVNFVRVRVVGIDLLEPFNLSTRVVSVLVKKVTKFVSLLPYLYTFTFQLVDFSLHLHTLLLCFDGAFYALVKRMMWFIVKITSPQEESLKWPLTFSTVRCQLPIHLFISGLL